MAKAKTITAAGVKLYINNQIFGIATSVEWTSDGGRRPIYGLDKITPFELAPGPSKTTGTVECIRVRLDGGLEGRGISAPNDKVLLEKYISIALVDRLTDAVILQIDEAAVSSQSWRVDQKGLVRGNFTFIGKDWANESEEA